MKYILPFFVALALISCAHSIGKTTVTPSKKDVTTTAVKDNKTTDNTSDSDKKFDNTTMSANEDVVAFIAEIVKRNKLNEKTVKGVFDNTTFDLSVLTLIKKPAESKTWSNYSTMLLSKDRINAGHTYTKEHSADLDNATAIYGVPQSLIVAIIGVESFYGQATFKRPAVKSIGTIAFGYPRREKYFKSELESLFILAHKEGVNPLDYMGSYAGAVGIPQFMPSNIAKFGKDGDGDGHVNIVKTHADAIHSVANYMKHFGWDNKSTTLALVTLDKNIDNASFSNNPCDKTKQKSVAELQKMGVKFPKTLDNSTKGILSRVDDDNDTYSSIVFFDNACPIHKYNSSIKYTTVVSMLAEILANPPKK